MFMAQRRSARLIRVNMCDGRHRYAFTFKFIGSMGRLVKSCLVNDLGSVVSSVAKRCTSGGRLISSINSINTSIIIPVLDSETGLGKNINEDSAGALTIKDCQNNSSIHIFALADGVSMLKDGHKASAMAVGGFIKEILSGMDSELNVERDLGDIINSIHGNIYSSLNGVAGTTIVAGYLRQEGSRAIGSLAYVGDSKAYRVSSDSSVEKLTEHDDRISGHTLSQALGYYLANIHVRSNIVLNAGEYMVITTDGIGDYINDRILTNIIMQGMGNPWTITKLLIRHARKSGSSDDATVITMWFYEPSML